MKLKIKKGLWFWKDKLFIPVNSEVKQKLLQEFHDSLLGGHDGYQMSQPGSRRGRRTKKKFRFQNRGVATIVY